MEFVNRFFRFDYRDKTDYKVTPPVLTQGQHRRISIDAKNYIPKLARKGAFTKKLSRKQRKQLKNK